MGPLHGGLASIPSTTDQLAWKYLIHAEELESLDLRRHCFSRTQLIRISALKLEQLDSEVILEVLVVLDAQEHRYGGDQEALKSAYIG